MYEVASSMSVAFRDMFGSMGLGKGEDDWSVFCRSTELYSYTLFSTDMAPTLGLFYVQIMMTLKTPCSAII